MWTSTVFSSDSKGSPHKAQLRTGIINGTPPIGALTGCVRCVDVGLTMIASLGLSGTRWQLYMRLPFRGAKVGIQLLGFQGLECMHTYNGRRRERGSEATYGA